MFLGEAPVLITESDVEQKVVMPLLTDQRLLAIPEANVQTKQYLAPAALDKAAGKLTGYYPDYSIWFHGLAAMVVEAKAPDVDAEEGYREASLYARHLNQKYPTGFNPCSRVMATNGKVFLFGYWDAAPEFTLSLSDLRVGTAALESVQAFCSGQVLMQFASQLSRQLKLTNVVYPYEILGGQAVLNAKLPLNTFAADLSPILRRYFSSTPQENTHEICEKAYVSSNEVTEYDRVLESLLRERLAFRQHAIVQRLEPRKHEEPHVAKAISLFD
ncbi:MAG TPA: type I restriction enzyme HsdR N-terminal domain-containing protein, partial [Candidatus Eremiobacteraceae bacterium]|nr:type I restriction enzyme HsdR N-terminal domain-containing protein [Candidatus Eremiobacteraceae bacterium]